MLETQEIVTSDDTVLHIRFLKDNVDFEVFFNGEQIDNSETSPKKVVDNLKWPIYFSIAWYILVIGFAYFFTNLFGLISYRPNRLIFDPATFYLITSSLVVLIILLLALARLKDGNMTIYFVALIAVCGDTLFGSVYQIFSLSMYSIEFSMIFVFAFVIPLIFKSAAVRGFITNIKKYKQYVHQKSLENRKPNPEIVDL